MQIDTEHLHHWMQAIRQSNNPMRTMDAFWSGQLKSKDWLIDCLDEHVPHKVTIDIHGGWVGVLASMIFQSNIPVSYIRSIDIDPHCEHIANEMNRLEYNDNRFSAITGDMVNIRSDADVVINTSAEHITQDDYDLWLSGLRHDAIIVLQSNDYDISEHIRTAKNLSDFKRQSDLTTILYEGCLELPLYNRFMLIGQK